MKAFYCSWPALSSEPSVRYAETASKARYRYWLDLSDVWPMAKLMEIKVSRAPALDRPTEAVS